PFSPGSDCCWFRLCRLIGVRNAGARRSGRQARRLTMGLTTRRKLTTALILTLLILAFALASAAPASAQGRSDGHGQKPETKTLIVKMAKGLTSQQQRGAATAHGGTAKAAIDKLDLQVIEVPVQAADAIIARLQGDPLVARVEEEHERRLSSTPSDDYYAQQGALPKMSWNDA